MDRRSLLAGGAALAGALAGCSVSTGSSPDVDPHTGLDRDTSHALDDERIALVGDEARLPDPPRVAASLRTASVALATPDAATAPLADAFRAGTAVAFAGAGAPGALASLLRAVEEDYHWGTETVDARPVGATVAVPAGDAVDAFHVVREGGWDDPVLDPLGWALAGRLPECGTFAPERRGGDRRLGRAWIAGRLPTGETYAARTTGRLDAARRLHLRTTVHGAATGGYPVSSAERVVDLRNDASAVEWFPNPHERGGVEVTNRSDPVEERLSVSFAPASDRARGALTGCCGLTADGTLGYDHRSRWSWVREGVLESERRHGGGSGRGTWHVHP